ncbi:MAG TPA: HAMP domain-containing sensor histidine kinase [Acidimicrobiia bacterium]|nr:HAMP domain-containing sensor histidine kinase [Acidimicrobiia bacterium]
MTDLRPVRLRLTAVFALVSAVSVGVLAFLAVTFGVRQIDGQAERDLQGDVAFIVGSFDAADPPTDEFDTWLVDARADVVTELGPTDLEPPTLSIGKDVVRFGPLTERYTERGDDYLLFAQQIPGDGRRAIVAASWLGPYQTDANDLRREVTIASIAVVLVTSLAGWLLAGRALRPARRALEQQRDFMANAAHELRTPIAVIQASASQALRRPRVEADYVRSMSEIQAAAVRAGSSISDMLDLARLEAGQSTPRRVPMRLDLLVEEIAAATTTNTTTVTVDAPEPVIVDADDSLLRQAIENVVQNSTRRAAHVVLRVRRTKRDVLVEIVDDGPGFAPELIPNVFQRWARGSGRADRQSTGIGLAIVATIMAAHGGRASATNGSDGGAVVTLRLPSTAGK